MREHLSPARHERGMSLHHMPRYLPALSVLLEDLGQPAPRQWARALGISERTAARWQAADDAPVMARLALFWVTRWGWSAVECEARFAVTTAHALCDSYRREIAALQAQVTRLQRLGGFGSANDPVAGYIACAAP
ncbi:MAG: hypothetical protein RL268_505 [Pseudomonadota bacterium]|jgi:hypothetical protein